MNSLSLFYYYRLGCADTAVGLTNTQLFPDSSFTATTTYNAEYAPHKSRMSSNRCWEPTGNTDPNDYLQIDFGTLYKICALSTRASGKGYNEWTEKYKLYFSTDNVKWTVYKENNNEKVKLINLDLELLRSRLSYFVV